MVVRRTNATTHTVSPAGVTVAVTVTVAVDPLVGLHWHGTIVVTWNVRVTLLLLLSKKTLDRNDFVGTLY